MTSQLHHILCLDQQKGLTAKKRHHDVKLNTVAQSSLCRISAQYLHKWPIFTFLWSQILRGTFCNFVAMLTAQNVMNSFDFQTVS